MTSGHPTPPRPISAAQGLLAALVGLALVLAAMVVGAVPAAAENGVGASTPVMINIVGPSGDIGAGQRLGETALLPWIVVATGVAAESATGAESALNGAQLSQHLAQLEKYGQAGFRELESGRIRYYGDLSPANKPGEMIGRRLVREWDPSSGASRTWHETLDGNGTVRIVRPETGGPKTHYYFDEFGNYGGSW